MYNHKSVRIFILNECLKLLLIYRPEDDSREPNKLILPGGRVEYGETLVQGIKRELMEELNVNINERKLKILGKETKYKEEYQKPLEIHYFYYPHQITIPKGYNNLEVKHAKYYYLNTLNKEQIAFDELDILKSYYFNILDNVIKVS